MGDQERWQVEGSAAELYQRYLVPAVTSLWACDLVDRSALRVGERVLDVACGTGVVARVAARRVGAAGHVAALDINAGMLAVAQSLSIVEGALVEWHEGSVLGLPFGDATFDVVFCQLGLQFFPNRPAALHEMGRVLVPDGRLALNVFGPIGHNPATQALAAALDRNVYAGASTAKRAEHALGAPEELRALVSDAGFRDIQVETERKMMHFPSVADYVRVQLSATPLASVAADYDDARLATMTAALVADLDEALSVYVGSAGLSFPQEVHCLLARK